jgi:hypothetical protein
MSSIKFKEHLVVNGNLDMTIEDVFKATAEMAGIHTFNFFDEFTDAFSTAAQWDTAGAEGTWTIVSNEMQGTGSSGWQFCETGSYTTPKAFVLEITADGAYGAVGVLATDIDNVVFCWWNNTSAGITYRNSDADTVLISLPKVLDTEKKLRISVQPQISADDCFISFWANGEFVANAHLGTYPTGRKLALGCYAANTVTFDDARIPELTEVLDVVTVDVGETPGGALSRAIGRRHINYFVRYDGSLQAWRPSQVASSATMVLGDVDEVIEIVDRRGLVSHWRQVGAWDSADAYNTTLLVSIGHRFHKDDNPDLMTEDDCQNEATLSLVRAQEYAHQAEVSAPFLPLLEPEDRIAVCGEDWLISSMSVNLMAGALIVTYNLR